MRLTHLLPKSVRKAVLDMLGISALREGTDRLESRLDDHEQRVRQLEDVIQRLDQTPELLWKTSRKRWKSAAPDKALTWGATVTGDAFIDKVVAHGGFDDSPTILELGPGYGRLLKSILAKGLRFSRYVGIDISRTNVEYLRGEFPSDRMQFIEADAEHCSLDFGYDAFIASLIMKHLYPTFEACLGNLARFANPGCRFFFDLLEGGHQHFEKDGITFIHFYTRGEVTEILRNLGLDSVAFDSVEHDPEHIRLFVVAEKAP